MLTQKERREIAHRLNALKRACDAVDNARISPLPAEQMRTLFGNVNDANEALLAYLDGITK